MKIFDSFMFCHELDLLEVRLRTLYDYVDHFVILECDYTHQNTPKPLYFRDNRSRFDFAKDKITHFMHKGAFEKGDDELSIEYEQRQLLYDWTLKLPHDGNDTLLISDVDEFPDRDSIKIQPDEPLVYEQDFYYYNINCPLRRYNLGTVITKFSNRFGTMRTMRDNRGTMPKRRGGWHFSYFMSEQEIAQKLASFAHHKYNKPPYTDKDYLEKNIREHTNFLGKKMGNIEPKPIPDYMMDELKKFPRFVGLSTEKAA